VADLSEQDEAFLERLRVDRGLLSRIVMEEDIRGAIEKEGFKLSDGFFANVEAVVMKIRGYITDQVHVLDAKKFEVQGLIAPAMHSGNGCQDW
jgi:hypothetical protein